jgi:NAD(P)-dependent dehydrogenase (short-subunit alcohol dehydrogenase family)
MARTLVTGSADGLGRLAAQRLLHEGHDLIVHARNSDRLTAVRDLVHRGAANSSLFARISFAAGVTVGVGDR